MKTDRQDERRADVFAPVGNPEGLLMEATEEDFDRLYEVVSAVVNLYEALLEE
jgi:hypothetical protein